MKLVISVAVFLYLGLTYSFAQTISASARELLSDNVVEIRATNVDRTFNEIGSGFVAGRSGDTIYIITAAHVVEKTSEVKVRFSQNRYDGEADVLKQSMFLDVAVLRIVCPGRSWRPFRYVREPKGGKAVYILSVRSERSVVDRGGAAILTSVDKEQLLSNVGAQHGDSGTPLFSGDALVGMVFKSPGLARPAMMLKSMLESWGIPWGLPEASPDLPPPIPPTRTTKDPIIPIRSIRDSKTQELITPLYDNDGSSEKKIVDGGAYSYIISFGEKRMIDQVRLYYPAHIDGDLPSFATLFFPSINKRIKLKAYKAPVIESNINGHWIIFNLRQVFFEEKVHFEFALAKYSDGTVFPFTFYEIQFRGPNNN
ncbi:hypothetical protein J2Y45_004079 [Dyadobacter sp. BE34]|uniref:Peptidase S1 and S6 chymotrypsin/Hap n=1 Tax=Dyadobacter fermentans TaxID=94254 RepID=A0ABU1R0F0_9BACT|nr:MULTISPECIES: serine protease [Dyadobacter]MDR6806887.1 hypothetical protein [Dyadobacter fermentans]MDR7044629.1 hypothetical protein [Dyadobacter sp. BE242]MDR7198939.1 hypothetical protein [Dyadobacter sp. BE34]MDR7216901.1 hypothetical protein [Dyadobacter sp. BE31]MDR7263573.1 hypothetical protein [Dyadobacter sp. BE32]